MATTMNHTTFDSGIKWIMPDNKLTAQQQTALSEAVTLRHADLIGMVEKSVESTRTKRAYRESLTEFFSWWGTQGIPQTKVEGAKPQLNIPKHLINAYKTHLKSLVSERTGKPLASASVNLKLSAVRKLITEAADNGLIDEQTAAAAKRVKGAKVEGVRMGNWLTQEQAEKLVNKPDPTTKKGIRDRAILGVLLWAGLRREECAGLTVEHFQQRDGQWVIVDLVGKRGKVRSVVINPLAKLLIDDWRAVAGIESGPIWRGMRKGDHIVHDRPGMSSQAIWRVVTDYAGKLGYDKLAPHDLRRSYAKIAHKNGCPIEQISQNLGHQSIAVTERYLGVELDLHNAPTSYIKLRIHERPQRLPEVG